MIRHLVFLKYATDVSTATKLDLIRDLGNLSSEIDGIIAFGHGSNVSPEESFTHGLMDMFWFDFADAATRDKYLDNETHKAIGLRIGSALNNDAKNIFVCDVEI